MPGIIYIFRRDLRIIDNLALNAAIKLAKNNQSNIIPIFIFDPRQIADNKWKSDRAIDFMIESLNDIPIPVSYFEGKPHDIVSNILTHNNISDVFVAADYTPFSRKRDQKIAAVCTKFKVNFHSVHDHLLLGTPTDKSYKVFTPFYKNYKFIKIPQPTTLKFTNYSGIKGNTKLKSYYNNSKKIFIGGRTRATKILKKAAKINHYTKNRDYLAFTTSQLSAYLKFGCVSVREVYHAVDRQLHRQLYWRDFYYNLMIADTNAFKSSYDDKWNIKWNNNINHFNKWKQGVTGFPIVDACMRELNATGLMHNRGRMIVASFLSKDLHLNWRDGERYFAQQLIDYDPTMNNYNWQMVAGTGSFALPYFRIFNPWIQSRKYDPDATYIKQWIPELRNIPAKHIHKWYIYHNVDVNYPKPMLDHDKAKEDYLQFYDKYVIN